MKKATPAPQPQVQSVAPTASAAPAIDVFAKAKGRAAKAPTKTTAKETVWIVGEQPATTTQDATPEVLSTAVDKYIEYKAQEKAAKTQSESYSELLKRYANGRYVEFLARTGVEPQSPIKIANSAGRSVTFVVQDKSRTTVVNQDQVDALTELLGEDAVSEILHTECNFGFNSELLNIPAVHQAVAAAINDAISKLVTNGDLSAETAATLLDYTEVQHFKPQTVERVAQICGKNAERIEKFLDIMAGACTRYVKA